MGYKGLKMGKGSEWERTISKKLSKWLTNNERDDCLWRSSMSGGRATQRAKFGEKTAGSYGDISALDDTGKQFLDYFSIECKAGYSKKIKVLDIIDGKKKDPDLLKHWAQCERDRNLANRPYSLVIFKRDRKIPCVIVSDSFMKDIYDHHGEYSFDNIIVKVKDLKLVIMRLDEFLFWLDPEYFIGDITK